MVASNVACGFQQGQFMVRKNSCRPPQSDDLMAVPAQCSEEPSQPAVSSCEEPISQKVTSQVLSYPGGMVDAIHKR